MLYFGGRFGPLLESWGDFGRLLGDFGQPLASTWGPWAQLGRLGLPLWSQKSTLIDFDLPVWPKSSNFASLGVIFAQLQP